MASSFIGLSISPISLARGASALCGVSSILVGTRALVAPSAYAVNFGFPPTSSAASYANYNPFIPVAGGHAIASGFALLGCSYLENDMAAGVIMIAGGVVPLINGITLLMFMNSVHESKPGEDRKVRLERATAAKQAAFKHWSYVVIRCAIGAWMVSTSKI